MTDNNKKEDNEIIDTIIKEMKAKENLLKDFKLSDDARKQLLLFMQTLEKLEDYKDKIRLGPVVTSFLKGYQMGHADGFVTGSAYK